LFSFYTYSFWVKLLRLDQSARVFADNKCKSDKFLHKPGRPVMRQSPKGGAPGPEPVPRRIVTISSGFGTSRLRAQVTRIVLDHRGPTHHYQLPTTPGLFPVTCVVLLNCTMENRVGADGKRRSSVNRPKILRELK
jgi:hypothetical protein